MDSHFEFPVDVYDEQGNVTGVKKRGEVDKKLDIVKNVHLLAFDLFGNVHLSMIPRQGDALWKGSWGTTCAGIPRHGEDAQLAISRTMQREVGIIEDAEFSGEEFHNFNGVKRFTILFTCTTKQKLAPNLLDSERIERFEPEEVEELIAHNRAAPTLEACWKMYKKL